MAVAERIPVDTIRSRAAAIDPAVAAAALLRMVLVVVALPFLLVGWTARILVRGAWAAATWVFAAVQVGWAQAGPRTAPAAEDGS